MVERTISREDPKAAANAALDAAKADEAEHQISIKDAFTQHRKAVLWSMALSVALVMEGEFYRPRTLGLHLIDLSRIRSRRPQVILWSPEFPSPFWCGRSYH